MDLDNHIPKKPHVQVVISGMIGQVVQVMPHVRELMRPLDCSKMRGL